jgi:hypothetical protein
LKQNNQSCRRLKKPVSKAAGESKPEEVPTALRGAVRPYNGSWRTEKPLQRFPDFENFDWYVEDFDEPRTKLAGFFSHL